MTDQWEKDRKQFEKELPSRFLSLTCVVIGIIHFKMSGWKADWILFAFVVLCFAPWLGYVFKSIGKDGVEFRDIEQGKTSVPEMPRSLAAPAPAPALAPVAHVEPPPVAAIPPQPEPNPNTFLVQEKKVLGTLWKYQKLIFPGSTQNRWTFTASQGSPDYMLFSIGFIHLLKRGLADIAPNGQVMLTNDGFEFCQRHDAQISSWRDTFDRFSN
jgi:hypothetical protein